MTERIIHNLVQGTPEWNRFRLEHNGASEAAAMLGLSSNMKRTELLRVKHTGNPQEFSDWVQENVLDYGHEVEALARPIVEAMIDQDLYPVTCSYGDLSASCDGLTMDEETAFEHKQWNETLAASVRAGVVPDSHMPQCQQIMMVTGAKRVVFVVSDGTAQRMEKTIVQPDQEWYDRIRAGWDQFSKDLGEFVPFIEEVKPIGKTPETLPALRLELTGKVTASNLAEYKDHALAVFAAINRDLTTDQHFADAEKTVKWCGMVEERLEAAKQHALSQTADIDALFRTIDEISAEARDVRLELDKLVTKRKAEIKDSIVVDGREAYARHITDLKVETGGAWVPLNAPDFAAAVKGKRSVASMRDAVDTLLANAKIEADGSAKRLRANIALLDAETVDYGFLFSDRLVLATKQIDDLRLVITSRIENHKAEQERRLAAERARIAEEERTKAEKKAREEMEAKAAEESAAAAREAAAAMAAQPEPELIVETAPAQWPFPAPEPAASPAPLPEIAPPAATVSPLKATRAQRRRPADAEIIETLAIHYGAPQHVVIEWLRDLSLPAAA